MEVKFKIVRRIAVIGKKGGGWNLELNVVKWGEHEEKYDLRQWNEDHTRGGKGVTLSEDEVKTLCAALEGIV